MEGLPSLFARDSPVRRHGTPNSILQRPMSAPSLSTLAANSHLQRNRRRTIDGPGCSIKSIADAAPSAFGLPSDFREPELYGRSAGVRCGRSRSCAELPSLSMSKAANMPHAKKKRRNPIAMLHLVSDRHEAEEKYKVHGIRPKSRGFANFRKASCAIMAETLISKGGRVASPKDKDCWMEPLKS